MEDRKGEVVFLLERPCHCHSLRVGGYGQDFRIGLTYGARSLPMTFMIDRQGIVRQQIFGARDWGAPEAHQLINMLVKS